MVAGGNVIAESLFRVLTHVEERSGTGVLAFQQPDGDAAGAVVVVDGRLCLVRGVKGVPRFTQILAERHPESSKMLTDAVRTAQDQRRLIGEVLIELGQLPLSRIRDCLREQVAACMVALAGTVGTRKQPRWATLDGSLDDRLTFSPREIYSVATDQLQLGDAPDFACYVYAHFHDEAAFSVLGVRAGRTVLPFAVDGVDMMGLSDVRALGQHIRAVAEPATLRAAGVEPRIVSFNAGREFGVVCVGETHIAMLGGLTTAGRGKILREAATRLRGAGDAP